MEYFHMRVLMWCVSCAIGNEEESHTTTLLYRYSLRSLCCCGELALSKTPCVGRFGLIPGRGSIQWICVLSCRGTWS